MSRLRGNLRRAHARTPRCGSRAGISSAGAETGWQPSRTRSGHDADTLCRFLLEGRAARTSTCSRRRLSPRCRRRAQRRQRRRPADGLHRDRAQAANSEPDMFDARRCLSWPHPVSNLKINGERLWDSLMEMAKIGPGVKGGNRRLTLTDVDREGRDLFKSWCGEGRLQRSPSTRWGTCSRGARAPTRSCRR